MMNSTMLFDYDYLDETISRKYVQIHYKIIYKKIGSDVTVPLNYRPMCFANDKRTVHELYPQK